MRCQIFSGTSRKENGSSKPACNSGTWMKTAFFASFLYAFIVNFFDTSQATIGYQCIVEERGVGFSDFIINRRSWGIGPVLDWLESEDSDSNQDFSAFQTIALKDKHDKHVTSQKILALSGLLFVWCFKYVTTLISWYALPIENDEPVRSWNS